MRELRDPRCRAPGYWTAWEFPDDWSSGLAHRRAFAWVKKKPLALGIGLAAGGRPRRPAGSSSRVSEHSLVMEALEKRIVREPTTTQGEWYEIPEEDLTALVKRRAADALDALDDGHTTRAVQPNQSGTSRAAGKLNPDGTLEPLDRNQG